MSDAEYFRNLAKKSSISTYYNYQGYYDRKIKPEIDKESKKGNTEVEIIYEPEENGYDEDVRKYNDGLLMFLKGKGFKVSFRTERTGIAEYMTYLVIIWS